MKPWDRVKIIKKCLTFGKGAFIDEWCPEINKWKVSFDEQWVGWYDENELELC